MPSQEFLTLVDRLRQASTSRDAARRFIANSAAVRFAVDGLAYRPGAQVIDLVSGQKGVVLAGERYTVIVEAPERQSG